MTTKPRPETPTYRGERCRGCGLPIVFVLTPKGKREPLERDAVSWAARAGVQENAEAFGLGRQAEALRAALRVVVILDGRIPTSLGLKTARDMGFDVIEHPETLVHVSHFATCPDRDRFRRG